MADSRDEIQAALDEARRAREEAERVRREAKREAERLRDEARKARDEARRLAEEARRQSREERRGQHGPHFGPGRPGPRVQFHFEGEVDPDATPSEQTFSMDGITAVQVNQTAGRLTVRTCKEGEVPGVASSGNKTTPEIQVTRDGERLHIEVKLNRGWLFRRRHGANTVVRLEDRPYDQVRIDNGYGETEISAITAADFRVHVGAGAIQCLLTRGHLEVDVGAGKVSVLSHSGLARCDSGTGDVLLDIAELAEGEYRVDVGLGRAEVRFPAGGEVHIRTASGIGKSRLEYPSAPESAKTRLRLNSGIGECIVRARDATGSTQLPPGIGTQAKPQRGGRAASASRRREAEEMRVLQMLEQGKISPQDAADLIAALQGSTGARFDDEEDEPPVFR